jgi:hypothetical protein
MLKQPVFGFASVEPDGSLSKLQVYGGLGQCRWQSDNDRRWYESGDVKRPLHRIAKRKSGLNDNQTDASLAVCLFDSIVLTKESLMKKGPLYLAAKQGGRIVYLDEIEKNGLSLKDYIAPIMQRNAAGFGNITSFMLP